MFRAHVGEREKREVERGGEREREVLSPLAGQHPEWYPVEPGDICLASNVSGSTQLQGTGTLHGAARDSTAALLLYTTTTPVRTGIITRTVQQSSRVGHLSQVPPNRHARRSSNNI